MHNGISVMGFDNSLHDLFTCMCQAQISNFSKKLDSGDGIILVKVTGSNDKSLVKYASHSKYLIHKLHDLIEIENEFSESQTVGTLVMENPHTGSKPKIVLNKEELLP